MVRVGAPPRLRALLGALGATAASALRAPAAQGAGAASQGLRFVSRPEAQNYRRVQFDYFLGIMNWSKADAMVPMRAQALARGSEYGRNVTIITHASSRGHWETFHTQDLCQPWANGGKGVFLDVGANVGASALPMADCVGEQGSVVAVEGTPSFANHLRAGIVANHLQNVVLYGYVVGDDSQQGSPKPESSADLQQFPVNLTTIDSILGCDEQLKGVLSMKVGIEGNEGHLLKGAQEFFSNYPPCFLTIELVHERLAEAGTPIEGVLRQLKRFGYKVLPTVEFLKTCKDRSKTVHLHQKNLDDCRRRCDGAFQPSPHFGSSEEKAKWAWDASSKPKHTEKEN